ncbi:MAG: response regulator [Bacteroidetes bacterium]|jgi:DNA-binding NarL/FixJ family response regulator|nr:response regulator [Bacteroidota bacterium]
MKKLKVLIVDDNPHFINALKFMLIDNFNGKIDTISTASNGEEALNLLEKNVFDTVFMDINMPVKNGIEATKEASSLYRNLIIVAVSFHSEMKYVVQMIEAGARSYIIKDEISAEALEKALEIHSVV